MQWVIAGPIQKNTIDHDKRMFYGQAQVQIEQAGALAINQSTAR
jgi:hypothetical protein